MNTEFKTNLDELFVVYDADRDAILRYRSNNDIILYGSQSDIMTRTFDAQGTRVADLPNDLRDEIYNEVRLKAK